MTFSCHCGYTPIVIRRKLRGIYQETDVYCQNCDTTMRYYVRCEEVIDDHTPWDLQEVKPNQIGRNDMYWLLAGAIFTLIVIFGIAGLGSAGLLALYL